MAHPYRVPTTRGRSASISTTIRLPPLQGTYNQWQTRIHYYHWLKMKAKCKQAARGLCEMGGFTRLL